MREDDDHWIAVALLWNRHVDYEVECTTKMDGTFEMLPMNVPKVNQRMYVYSIGKEHILILLTYNLLLLLLIASWTGRNEGEGLRDGEGEFWLSFL